MFKLLRRATALGGLGYTIYDTNTDEQLILRGIRTLRVGFKIIYNYKIKFNEDNVNEIHEDTASAIYNLCRENDGLYVKFGQQVAASEHMLPPIYFKYFVQLQDQAKSSGMDKVQKILKEELQIENLDEIFEEFDEEPIASASIAQVHRAKLKKNGETVAVKIQKPNIKRQFKSDMFFHHLFCFAIDYAFDLPLLAFQETIEQNLKKEIDFTIESNNAEQVRLDLDKVNRKDVYIPQIHHEYTNERVMIMEWVDGIKITEKEQLEKLNYNVPKLLNTVVETFSEQIFITGFVHCDPHPGNILVRRDQNNEQQVILLDFGLCIPIRESFRLQYCKFWQAIFLQNTAQMKEIVSEWGVGNEDAFASAQLMRPYNKEKHINEKITKQDVFELQMKFKDEFKKMLGDTTKFPDELVFIGRNMNLVRSINKKMGSIVNRINVMVKFAVKGLNYQNIDKLEENNNIYDKRNKQLVRVNKNTSILQRKQFYQQKLQVIIFSCRLFVSSVLYKFLQLWLKLTKNQTFEDALEQEMQKQIDAKYEQFGMKPMDEHTYNA